MRTNTRLEIPGCSLESAVIARASGLFYALGLTRTLLDDFAQSLIHCRGIGNTLATSASSTTLLGGFDKWALDDLAGCVG